MAKTVIVLTGASQGIGSAIARVFAKQLRGVQLALIARSEGNLKRVARSCLSAGADVAEIFPCDVSDAEAVSAMGAQILKRFGSPDILINNAGNFRPAPFLKTTVEDFDASVGANLRSTFLVSKAFVPAMAKRRRGHVFNMSSIAGLDAYPGAAAYCAAKFGIVGLTKVMREELKGVGVRVTLICPGATFSPSWSGSNVREERLMPAEDVARAFIDVYQMSARTVVEEVVLRPQLGDL